MPELDGVFEGVLDGVGVLDAVPVCVAVWVAVCVEVAVFDGVGTGVCD